MTPSPSQVLISSKENQKSRRLETTVDQYDYSKHAKRLVKDVLCLKPGENLTIEALEHNLPLAKEVRFQARKMGANALLVVEDDENYFRLVDEGFGKHLGRIGTHEWALVENSDAYVFFPGPGDYERQTKLDPKKRREAQAYNLEWYRRATKAGVRGVRIRSAYVTPTRARMMGFDYKKWMSNTLEAIDIDYQKIDREGRRLARLLKDARNLKIKGPRGTSLRMELSGIPPHLYSGMMPKALKYNVFSSVMNIPGSELDVVPKVGTIEGTVYFDRPNFSDDKKIEGLKWTFKNGKLVGYSASKNIGLFRKGYLAAKGDKDKVGVLAIGLNPKLLYGFNQDFWVAVSLTIGIGTLGEGDKNKTDYSFSATLSKATVLVDDKKIIDEGRLLSV